jgi:aminoglycoside phosphotransferase (APT) family kinase protein
MAESEILQALRRMSLLTDDEPVKMTALTGGVSSDIHLVETASRRFCVKRALARLKVASVWEAPLGRNAAEASWMRAIAQWLPNAVPEILGEDSAIGLFAMSYLPPESNPVWKAKLLAGEVDLDFAERVGRDLATIHRLSAVDASIPGKFANDDTFEQIRLEPYLRATARNHPDLASQLNALADVTLETKSALVHGDVSPKNMLCGQSGPVFLDAECAWYGDPAFDMAFCLNHLLLKGARRGVARGPYLAAYRRLVSAYLAGVDWEASQAVEQRIATLLPALFLARVDGKSPVEYLTHEDEKAAVRRFAIPLIRQPETRPDRIADLWHAAA